MLVIRLFRVGKVNQPSFKIVVTDKRKPPRAGRFVEEVGFWNPVTKEKVLRQDRIKYWLSVGAKPSPTIHNLLISEKIVEGKKIPLHKKKKIKEAASAPVGATAGQVEKPKEPSVVPVPSEAPAAEKVKPAPEKIEKETPKKEKEKAPEQEKPVIEKPAEEKTKEETPVTEEKK